MNDPDHDLKERFARLRSEESAAAPPAARIDASIGHRRGRKSTGVPSIFWKIALPAAALVLALAWWPERPDARAEATLDLPPLLPAAEARDQLFARLETPSAGLSTDDLLPFHLTISLFN